MKPPPSSEHDEKDREMIKLLEDLGSIKTVYPPQLLAARRAAFLAHVERLTAADTVDELPAGDQEIVKLFENLKSAPMEYPADLLAARRVAFLAQVDQLTTVDEGLSAGDQEIVQLLGQLRSARVEYPPALLAARRSAFLGQMKRAGETSVLDRLRISVQRIFSSKGTIPSSPAGFTRLSLVMGSLIAAVLVGSLFLRGADQAILPSPLQPVTTLTRAPTGLLPTTGEVAIAICNPGDETSPCPSGELESSQDLANPENGAARPAVSKDARYSQDQVHKAAYVNDGRQGASWVSDSPDSWVKIDLGQVRTINTISLQKGSLGSSYDNDPGQFVISVALSDVYADGDSSDDYMEYTQVFHSEQAGFSGMVSHMETIRTQFPTVQARFVKITFEKAEVAIDEVGVFMVPLPELAEQPATKPPVDAPEITLSPANTDTPLASDTATPAPSVTWLPTDTAVLVPTGTPTALPTNTLPPTVTATLVLINPFPSDTPIPLSTVVPPTAVPATIQASPASIGTILVSGNDQTLTFTCNGAAAEIRGHANTITLLGSCSSITVIGNGNRVFWESGSPVITDRGKDNLISQL